MEIRTYSELIKLPTFFERYEYLKLGDRVGEETFGFDRYLNQRFYKSKEWRDIRNYIITRDSGCDLGILTREIPNGVKVLVHHMNPIRPSDIRFSTDYLANPEYLITTIKRTHDAIHFGDDDLLFEETPIVRLPNDTCPWKL